MKIKHALILLPLLLLGCQAHSHFLGMIIDDPYQIESAFVSEYDANTKSHRYVAKKANDSILMEIKLWPYGVEFKLINNSKSPLDLNMYRDKFSIITHNRYQYELNTDKIYGMVDYIQHNHHFKFSLRLPSGVKPDQVKYVIAHIGLHDVTIMAKASDS